MKEILNVLIPYSVSIVIALLLYLFTKNKWLVVVVSVVLLLVSSGIIYKINISERAEETSIQKTSEEVWKSIEVNFKLNNYEHMLEIAEENKLMESEKMLNILGIMYAQGIYYERDYDKALMCLKAAAAYGELESTFINLWLASYVADIEAAENSDISYNNCIEALKIAEKHQNHYLNEMLKMGIYLSFGERVEDGYSYVKKLFGKDKKDFLKLFYQKCKTLKYLMVTDYDYYTDATKDLSTGEIEYDNVVAMAHTIEEWDVPVYIFVADSPSEYEIFEDLTLVPFKPLKHIVTGKFEYETSYLNEDGNTCFWKDTDEIFYGNEPPETDENSRWMIMSYDDQNQVRKYRKQVKE